jgi:hypothetical protein
MTRSTLFGGIGPNGALSDTWVYGALTPATASSTGPGCGGTAGAPVLVGNQPHLGNASFTLEASNLRSQSPTLFALSITGRSLTLTGACKIYVGDPIIPIPSVSSVAGFASLKLQVPLNLLMRGLELNIQVAVLDPGAPLGVGLSNGLRCIYGD